MLLFITVTWFYIQTVFTTIINYNFDVIMWKRDDFVFNKYKNFNDSEYIVKIYRKTEQIFDSTLLNLPMLDFLY